MMNYLRSIDIREDGFIKGSVQMPFIVIIGIHPREAGSPRSPKVVYDDRLVYLLH